MLYASGLRNVGTDHLLDFLKVYAPSPAERAPIAVRGKAAADGGQRQRQRQPRGSSERPSRGRSTTQAPLAIYVYKTMTDPFTGRVTFFKVISGKMKSRLGPA